MTPRPSTHFVTEGIDRDSKRSGQTEIADLQFPSPVDEQVLRLQIPV